MLRLNWSPENTNQEQVVLSLMNDKDHVHDMITCNRDYESIAQSISKFQKQYGYIELPKNGISHIIETKEFKN